MANQSISKEKSMAPRIKDEQLKDIVEFFNNNGKDYNLTIETYHDKWGKEYKITKAKLNSWVRIHEEGGAILREKSLLPLYIFEILRKHSSPQNPLTESQIKKIIEDDKIFAEIDKEDRKIIPRHTNGLVRALPNLIVKKDTPRNKASEWYYNNDSSLSYGLLTQSVNKSNFSLEEMTFLVDMIKDSRIISSECTGALLSKLIASMDESCRQELKTSDEAVTLEDETYKSENTLYLDYNKEIDEAKIRGNKITISYKIDGDEESIDLTPIKIDRNRIDGKYYLFAVNPNLEYCTFPIEDITFLAMLEDKEDDIDELDDEATVEDEKYKLNKVISLDSLFFNLREINHAIANAKYLTFSYLSYELQSWRMIPELIPSLEITVIPFATTYKNGKSYLLALSPEDHFKTVCFRVDLIQNIKTIENIDFTNLLDTPLASEYTEKHPFMLSDFKEIEATFFIKADNLDRVIDTFGNYAQFIDQKKAKSLLEGNLAKLARTFPELNFSSHLGFKHDDVITTFKVKTTEEETLRFALQNGDCVELCAPKYLRERIFDIAAEMEARHSKTAYDSEQKRYRDVMVGKNSLVFNSYDEQDKKVRLRIENEKTFDKVTKLKIKNLDKALSKEELEKYVNVEELVIEGNGVDDFSWIANLSALRKLTLINTSLKDGSVLAEIPQLDMLLINRNSDLESYDFLKTTKIGRLFVGRNGKADVAALYELTSVDELVIEENLLFDIDMERIWKSQHENAGKTHHMSVRRWIDDFNSSSEMPRVYRLPSKR